MAFPKSIDEISRVTGIPTSALTKSNYLKSFEKMQQSVGSLNKMADELRCIKDLAESVKTLLTPVIKAQEALRKFFEMLSSEMSENAR